MFTDKSYQADINDVKDSEVLEFTQLKNSLGRGTFSQRVQSTRVPPKAQNLGVYQARLKPHIHKKISCCVSPKISLPKKKSLHTNSKRLEIFTYKKLYLAYKKCRKNKRNTLNQLNFEVNLSENLIELENELKQKTYRPSRYICFLTRSPKLREVFAANFKDRIVHHLLLNEIEDFYENLFIDDVYNNRKNKGIHKATQKAKTIMKQNPNGYYLQLDIKGFFYNLDKNILFKTIHEDINRFCPFDKYKKDLLWLSNIIIYHNVTKDFHFKGNIKALRNLPDHKTLLKRPKHVGLPIGNVTSQFFANVYMYRFDNFVKDMLKTSFLSFPTSSLGMYNSFKAPSLGMHSQVGESVRQLKSFGGATLVALGKAPNFGFKTNAAKAASPKIASFCTVTTLKSNKNTHYIRYVDDFVLFSDDKNQLLHVKEKISRYLQENLRLNLREDSKLKPNKAGLDFLGYIIKPTHTLVRKRVVNNFKYKKAKFLDKYENQKGKMPLEEIKEFLSLQASFISHSKWANSYRLNSKLGVIDEEKYLRCIGTSWNASCNMHK